MGGKFTLQEETMFCAHNMEHNSAEEDRAAVVRTCFLDKLIFSEVL